jgi:hypothetical protein
VVTFPSEWWRTIERNHWRTLQRNGGVLCSGISIIYLLISSYLILDSLRLKQLSDFDKGFYLVANLSFSIFAYKLWFHWQSNHSLTFGLICRVAFNSIWIVVRVIWWILSLILGFMVALFGIISASNAAEEYEEKYFPRNRD